MVILLMRCNRVSCLIFLIQLIALICFISCQVLYILDIFKAHQTISQCFCLLCRKIQITAIESYFFHQILWLLYNLIHPFKTLQCLEILYRPFSINFKYLSSLNKVQTFNYQTRKTVLKKISFSSADMPTINSEQFQAYSSCFKPFRKCSVNYMNPILTTFDEEKLIFTTKGGIF